MWIDDPVSGKSSNRTHLVLSNPSKLWKGDIVELSANNLAVVLKKTYTPLNFDTHEFTIVVEFRDKHNTFQLTQEQLPGLMTVFRRLH